MSASEDVLFTTASEGKTIKGLHAVLIVSGGEKTMLCVAQLIKSMNCCSPADGKEKPNTPLTNLETYAACVFTL